ncbi:MAG TPA: MoaD/ThiS family protein [Candidatus Nanoarchaeia archaeon]|nr:MoaD/ThiS family protein [Candidatus Nanoarchaeia archaeon]
MVIVHNEKLNTTEEISFSGTVQELLHKLAINPETVLVVRNNEVLVEDETISKDDVIEILSVISGG